MASRLKAWAGLAFMLGLSAWGRAAEMPAPQGLTLRAGSNGVMLLLWEPMQRDDLMGYSIWKRPEGKGEYTRVSVPVKRGQEVVKLPLTTKASFLFKDKPGALSELRVAAEFEDARGPASSTVSTRRAKRVAEAFGAAASPATVKSGPSPTPEAGSSTESSDPSPTPIPSKEATPDEEARIEAMEEGGKKYDAPEPYLGAFPKAGRFRSTLEFGMLLDQVDTRGTDFLADQPGTAEPWDAGRPWDASFQYGTMQGRASLLLGLGSQIAASASMGWMGASQRWSDLNISNDPTLWEGEASYQAFAITDLQLGFLMRPVATLPLQIGLGVSLPTGLSRFRAYSEGMWDIRRQAGTGLGMMQSRADFSWGAQASEPGNRFTFSYQPSLSESLDIEPIQGFKVRHDMTRGAVAELRLGRTFPWLLKGRVGSLHVGVLASSTEAGRASLWVFDVKDLDKLNRAQFRSATGTPLEREDHVGARLEYWQAVGLGVWAKGIFEARLKPNGYVLDFSGGLVY